MTDDYKSTLLWEAAFGDKNLETENQRPARDRLLNALAKLEERIAPRLAKISESCHGLTIHDISHVHQLWSVASQICGPDYRLNPLEGFVLGAAFLVHDAGLTAASFPGGLLGLRTTSYYRDRVSVLLKMADQDPTDEALLENPPEQIAERALFDTLRAIHARRAETLLDEINPHPLTGRPYPLFPEEDLFVDCGEVIGLVAASHHWNIDDVDDRFRDPLTAPGDFPGWQTDALKLACILRTADACAIDERRARIMPFLLLNPTGVSRQHWAFQAHLKPCERSNEALVFQSNRAFGRAEMSAWWVAFDAIRLADQELRDCDRLLRDRAKSGRHPSLQPFAARCVQGAGEPFHLKEDVKVFGWTPVNTAVRIENPISLVQKFGGWQLYGNDVSAPIREALQNAADAVRARRCRNHGYESNSRYPGRIDIKLEWDDPVDQRLTDLRMIIADDGVGMSPGTMTGALLDFGRSFWDSSEAAEKYPGLLSDPFFQPTGKFGIGFYSIFMVADDVKVISRPWQSGSKDAKVLHFKNGTLERAEFRDYSESEDGYQSPTYSTIVIARVKFPQWMFQLAQRSQRRHAPVAAATDEFWSDFSNALRQLVFALDVECWLSWGLSAAEKLNEPGVLDWSPAGFTERFNSVFLTSSDSAQKGFSQTEISLVDEIRDKQNRVHTRGCINVLHEAAGVWFIGGFQCWAGDHVVKGFRSGKALNASRNALSSIASKDELVCWGTKQLKRVLELTVDPLFKLRAIARLSVIDVDITRDAMVVADGEPQPVTDVVDKLGQTASIFVIGQIGGSQFTKSIFQLMANEPFFSFTFDDVRDFKHTLRISCTGVAGDFSYCEILGSLEAPTNRNSAYGSLHKALKDAGFSITITPPDRYVIGTYKGPKWGRGHLMSRELIKGAKVKMFGFVMRVTRNQAKKKSPRSASAREALSVDKERGIEKELGHPF